MEDLIKLPDGNYFSHGDNLLDRHVDAIMSPQYFIESHGEFLKFVRKATKEEVAKYCHEKNNTK